jgi:glutathione S-transferase
MPVTLFAYRFSVYSWIARLVLAEKGVPCSYIEVNPFAPDLPPDYLTRNPFRRVPTLMHGDFVLFETTAITRYVDEAFAGVDLQPEDGRRRARMAQIIAIVDAYGYWPMVRQVFSHRVFRPRIGHPTDEREIKIGIISSERTLAALETLAEPGDFLVSGRVSLADLHLAPMMAYFTAAAEGRAALAHHEALSAWWASIRNRPAFVATDPGLPDY